MFQANSLYKCLLGAELQGVEYVDDVIRELEKEVELVKQATKGNHKVAKVCTFSTNHFLTNLPKPLALRLYLLYVFT